MATVVKRDQKAPFSIATIYIYIYIYLNSQSYPCILGGANLLFALCETLDIVLFFKILIMFLKYLDFQEKISIYTNNIQYHPSINTPLTISFIKYSPSNFLLNQRYLDFIISCGIFYYQKRCYLISFITKLIAIYVKTDFQKSQAAKKTFCFLTIQQHPQISTQFPNNFFNKKWLFSLKPKILGFYNFP